MKLISLQQARNKYKAKKLTSVAKTSKLCYKAYPENNLSDHAFSDQGCEPMFGKNNIGLVTHQKLITTAKDHKRFSESFDLPFKINQKQDMKNDSHIGERHLV